MWEIVSDRKRKPAKLSESFHAMVTVLVGNKKIVPGCSLTLHCNGLEFKAKFAKFVEKYSASEDKQTQNPGIILKKEIAMVEIVPENPIYVESSMRKMKMFGYFSISFKNQTIGYGQIGMVQRVKKVVQETEETVFTERTVDHQK